MEFSTIIIIAIVGGIFLLLRMWFLTGYRGTPEDEKKTKSVTEPLEQRHYSIGKIIETNTSYKSLGTEERIIDNSKSNGTVKRRLTISREWKKSISIDEETNKHLKGKLGIPFLSIEGEISKSLSEKYSSTIEETKQFSEEIELEIVPHSKIVLSLDWKMILQNGEIEVLSDENEVICIAFNVVKGITFDQIQQKIN